MESSKVICTLPDEGKEYPYLLTCLTLFFELPTLNIPTVWRPASRAHQTTVLLYDFLLKVALTQSNLGYVCT